MRSFGPLVLAVLLLLSLVACQQAEPTPATPTDDEITTTTTTTTATTTAKKPTTTTATTSNATLTTLATGTTETGSTDPYEVKDSDPGKDKQRLLFVLEGADVEFTFDKAMRYPRFDDVLMWHYTGTTKSGAVYTCMVLAERNTIYRLDCHANYDHTKIKEEDAHTYMEQFLEDQKLSASAGEFELQEIKVSMRGDPPSVDVYWDILFPMEQEYDSIYVTIRSKDGKLYVERISAQHQAPSLRLPYCLENNYDMFVPRWISE